MNHIVVHIRVRVQEVKIVKNDIDHLHRGVILDQLLVVIHHIRVQVLVEVNRKIRKIKMK